MVIADTSVWVDFLRGAEVPHCETLASLLEEQEIALCDRVLQELLQGIGHALAIAAARNYRRLRSLGIAPRSATDVLIATFCIDEGHRLLHNDRDFHAMEKHLSLRVPARRRSG